MDDDILASLTELLEEGPAIHLDAAMAIDGFSGEDCRELLGEVLDFWTRLLEPEGDDDYDSDPLIVESHAALAELLEAIEADSLGDVSALLSGRLLDIIEQWRDVLIPPS